jgi:hypothetical protein
MHIPCTEVADDTVAADHWVQQTALVRTWAAMKQEILLHKWYESERAGQDIGWDRAAVDWLVRYGCRRRGAALPE